MEGFMVDTTNLNNCANDIQGYGDRIKDLKDSVRSIRLGMRHKLSARERIDKTLRGIEERMLEEVGLMSSLDQALVHIMAFYRDTERKLADQKITSDKIEKPLVLGNVQSEQVFDDSRKGRYGGDQGSLASDDINGYDIDMEDMEDIPIIGKFFKRDVWFEDKAVYEFVKQRKGYEDYTDIQIHELIEQMSKEGCGYIGIVNAIFAEYEGSEEEFYDLFGFPMRDKDGNYNYDYMFIDLYCATDDKYFMDKPGAVSALTVDILGSYQNNPDSFLKKYGIELFDKNGKYNGDAVDAVSQEIILGSYQNDPDSFLKKYGIELFDKNGGYTEDATAAAVQGEVLISGSQSVETFASDGTNVYTLENRLIAYLQDKGIDPDNISYDYSDTMDTAAIKSNIDDGKVMHVNLLPGTEMYQDKGATVPLNELHLVTITGVTDDGRYIVSSWGKKYYIDPAQAKVASYQTINLDLKQD